MVIDEYMKQLENTTETLEMFHMCSISFPANNNQRCLRHVNFALEGTVESEVGTPGL
jgi:hypothetical protein